VGANITLQVELGLKTTFYDGIKAYKSLSSEETLGPNVPLDILPLLFLCSICLPP